MAVNRDAAPVLVVTGTRREGALATGPGVVVLAGGGDGIGLAADLARLAPDAAGIISFGMAGGLVSGLPLGALVIGDGVVGTAPGECDPAWIHVLAHALPRAAIGPIFADGTLLADAAAKARAARTGAIAADMESHLAAAAAARHGLPLAVLRCISDPADVVLPPAVAVAMGGGGSLALGAVLGSILRRPGQVPALIRTGTGFARAFAALQRAAIAAGPRLGCSDPRNG